MTDYDALRAAAEAATPGPWFAWDRGVGWYIALDGSGSPNFLPEGLRTDLGRAEDAAYIAAASPDVVLGLLDELAAAEADYRAVSDSLDAIMDQLEAAEAKVAAVEGLHHPLGLVFADQSAAGRKWPCDTAYALSEAPLTAAQGPDVPEAHHDGERGGEAGGRV